MNCVILQPSYIPWRGYFDQIRKADLFIFYDDVEYDKHGWRNRNRVKTAGGTQWLTIPAYSKGSKINHTPINEIAICWNSPWNGKHLTTLKQAYRRAPYFTKYLPLLEEIYCQTPNLLADFTIKSTIVLARELGLTQTRFMRSSELGIGGRKTDRVISILGAVGATHYITGPSARDYLEVDKFEDIGVTVEYMDYTYPTYPQLHPPYDPYVSILDLLFTVGPAALDYIMPPVLETPCLRDVA